MEDNKMAMISLDDRDGDSEIAIHDVDRSEVDSKIPGLTWKRLVSCGGCHSARIEIGGVTFCFFTKE